MITSERIHQIIHGSRGHQAPALLRHPETDRYALVGAALFDSVIGDLREGLAIQVEGATIVQVCPAHELPEGIPIVDVTGCYVTPGLIDAHVHS